MVTVVGSKGPSDLSLRVRLLLRSQAAAARGYTWLPEIEGLEQDTLYRVHVVTQDLGDGTSSPNTSPEAVAIDARTLDVKPPSFVNGRPYADDVWCAATVFSAHHAVPALTCPNCNCRYTNFTLVVQIDEGGACSYVVVPEGSPSLSAGQVQAGTSPAAPLIAAGQVDGMLPFTDSRDVVLGLEEETTYDLYVLCRDAAEPEPKYMLEPYMLPVTTAGAVTGTSCIVLLLSRPPLSWSGVGPLADAVLRPLEPQTGSRR